MELPTPHLDKFNASIINDKMPQAAIDRLKSGLPRYHQWIAGMAAVEGTRNEVVTQLVKLFSDYKFYVDFDLIYSCEEDFLYRQKGQLKLDNTVIEEFLPHLIFKAFPELNGVNFGPTQCFSAAYFKTSLKAVTNGGGLSVRTKIKILQYLKNFILSLRMMPLLLKLMRSRLTWVMWRRSVKQTWIKLCFKKPQQQQMMSNLHCQVLSIFSFVSGWI